MYFTLLNARKEAIAALRRVLENDEDVVDAAAILLSPDLDAMLADVPSFEEDMPPVCGEVSPSSHPDKTGGLCPDCAAEEKAIDDYFAAIFSAPRPPNPRTLTINDFGKFWEDR